MLASAFRSIFAAVVLLVAFPAVCIAQADAPIARPEVKAGDRWVYHRMDYWTNRSTATREMQVTVANDKIIQIVATEAGKPEIDESYTSDWNAVATSTNVFYPDNGLLKFPLRVGATYPVAYESVFGKARDFRVKHERTARVVGWEEVTVPAGKFRALKVELDGSFQRLDTSIAGSARNVIWYAPEVKRWVKQTYEDVILTGPRRGPNNKFGEELVNFKVQ